MSVKSVKNITGMYTKDANFYTVFCDGIIYTIARGTGEWGSRKIGDSISGLTLTKDEYKRLESQCDEFGSFQLDLDDE